MRKPAPKLKTRPRAPVVKNARREPEPQNGIDAALIEQLAAIITRHDLSEVEIGHMGLNIRVSRDRGALAPVAQAIAPPAVAAPAAPIAALTAPASAPESKPAADHPGLVKSPMVGTAYRRPSPEATPFVEVGAQVKVGDRIMLVEAMKTFNEILASRAGAVTAVFVDDGQPVEYGEPLVLIE